MLYVSLFQNSYILSVSLIAMICRNVLWASWPLSHGSWNYNYLCNQYLSLLMLWVRISIRTRCTTLCDKVVSDLRQVCGFLRVLQFPPPIKLTATILLALNTIKQKKTKKRNVLCLIVTVVQMLPVWLVTTNVLCLVDTKCPKCTMVNFSIWQNGLCLIAILWSDVLCV